jgi:hypothetical protein
MGFLRNTRAHARDWSYGPSSATGRRPVLVLSRRSSPQASQVARGALVGLGTGDHTGGNRRALKAGADAYFVPPACPQLFFQAVFHRQHGG